MARYRRIAASSALLALALSAGATGVAHADNSITECIAANQGVTDIVCHEVTKLPGTPTMGRVQVSWKLVPGDMTDLRGGLWMIRGPIKGQKTGVQVDLPNDDSNSTCSSNDNFSGCITNYSGPEGSFVLDFPVSMAGYQYLLLASEELSNAIGDKAGADLRDGTEQVFVWANKAFSYKDKGKTVVKRTCPASMKRSCKPAIMLVVNDDPGNGMPVSPLK